MYHPDKNKNGKEEFSKILKAYETLSNPMLRSNYDFKLKYNYSQPTTSQPKTKNWSFEEKELKRRQYYNEHYKKNKTTFSKPIPETENKKSYNEFKYVLFAIPLAVALFLLIINLALPNKPFNSNQKNSSTNANDLQNKSQNIEKKEEVDSSLIYLIKSPALKLR